MAARAEAGFDAVMIENMHHRYYPRQEVGPKIVSAMTADLDLAEAARAAVFFGADGAVVTGRATGKPTAVDDVREVRAAVELPVAIASGLTPDNVAELRNSGNRRMCSSSAHS